MPTFALLLKASEAENIGSVEPVKGRRWGLKFQCSSCNEISPNYVYVDENEEVEADGGTAHCVFSCKFCKKQISCSVDVKAYGSYDGGNQPQQVIAFIVRGGAPVEAHLEDMWVATASTSETQFREGVCLDEDWSDYDDKGDQSVSILEPVVTFQRLGK